MLGILSLLLVVTSTVPLLALMERSAAAAPGDDPWVAPNDLTSTRATSSINWLSRLSFRSPLSIVDSAGDVEYRTTSDIFDNGSTNFLRDGDGSNAWYLYVPVGQDKKPLENPANKCFGGFLVELDEGGEDMWLHALQPKRSTDGTACIYGRRSAVQGRVSDGIGDEERQFMFDIGSGGQEIDGKSDRWRFFVAGFFWAHKDSINAFDSSKKPFVPLTGAELDTARSDWQSTQAPNAPPEAARKASGWRFFKSGDCKEEILVVTPSNKDVYIFHYPDDSLVSKSDDGFAGCAYGREMNGDSTDHIEAVSIPASVAFSENATKAEGEVDPTEFEGSGNSVTSGTEEETELPETCATKLADNSALAWVLCPIINMAESLIGKIDEMLSRFLFVDLGRFNTNSGLFVAWNNIRQISTVILVIIALIMIFSEAMGEGFLSNYSVKKILPRLVLAVIGIQFSWVLTREFINISNILGNGFQGLMLAPFAGIKEGLGAILPVGDLSGAAQAGYFVAIFAAIPVAFGALATVAIGVFIALVIAFVTLILRYMVIVIGVMFAPIGIAMSVLPGTQKVSKLWWESLEKAVIMYPIIMAMLAAGKIIAFGLLQPVDGQSPDGWFTLGAIIAYFAPYALLPAALKLGGTALGKLTGAFNDKSKGVFDRMKEANTNRKKARSAAAERRAFAGQKSWYEKGGKLNPIGGAIGYGSRSLRKGSAYARQGGFGISQDDRAIRAKVSGMAIAGYDKEQMDNAGLQIKSLELDKLDLGTRNAALGSIMGARTGERIVIKDADGNTVGTVRATEAMQRTAAQTLASSPANVGQYTQALQALESHGAASDGVRQQILRDTGGEMKDKLPSLFGKGASGTLSTQTDLSSPDPSNWKVGGVSGGLNTIGGGDLSKMDPSELRTWQSQFQTALQGHRDAVAAGDTNLAAAHTKEINRFLGQINANSKFLSQGNFGEKLELVKNATGGAADTEIQRVFASDGKMAIDFDSATGTVTSRVL